jgi:hypothetical protein
MKKLLALQLAVIYAVCLAATMSMAYAEEKDVKVNGKTMEVRVPKSAHTDCKDKANAEKTECKKQPKEMPKIEKPVVEKKAEPAKK